MLNVLFGERTEDAILDVDRYFNGVYEFDWFEREDPVIKSIVKDIDKSELIGMNVISPYLGSISIEKISGGAKTLIMLYKLDNFVTDTRVMGNNCEDWLLRIAQTKDIKICTTSVIMRFNGRDDLIAQCINDGDIIVGYKEYRDKLIKYIVGVDV